MPKPNKAIFANQREWVLVFEDDRLTSYAEMGKCKEAKAKEFPAPRYSIRAKRTGNSFKNNIKFVVRVYDRQPNQKEGV